jgi:hypothetical protein
MMRYGTRSNPNVMYQQAITAHHTISTRIRAVISDTLAAVPPVTRLITLLTRSADPTKLIGAATTTFSDSIRTWAGCAACSCRPAIQCSAPSWKARRTGLALRRSGSGGSGWGIIP